MLIKLKNYNKFKILMIIILFQTSSVWALTPETKVTLRIKNAKLEDFLNILENSTGYSFIYGEEIKLRKRITLDIDKKPLQAVLEQVFRNEEIGFLFEGKHILLNKKEIKAVSRKYTISGYITDGTSLETLIGANIFESRHSQGTTTNPYGFYSITIPEGEVNLKYSYIGYETLNKTIYLKKDTTINILMKDNYLMQEVIILSDKTETGIRATQMSAIDIPVNHIKNIPGVLGEVDVLKSIQLVPGVQSGVEGSAGIHVRGGGPDQNLILLDGVPLYNVEHVLGFFSVFTPEAVKKVSFFKGSFPARFGGRLSSVVDVRTNDGDMQKYHGTFSLGLLSSKIQLEGPIIKNKTSFNISARRSYLDLVIKPFLPKDEKGGYYFYDVNAKVNHRFNDKNRLFLSAYHGKDRFFYKYDTKTTETHYSQNYDYYDEINVYKTESELKQTLDWGNTVLAARWNSIFSNKLFSNTTIAYNNYHFNINFKNTDKKVLNDFTEESQYDSDFNSGIRDFSYNIDFDYNPTPKHHIKFGGGYIFHTFKPEVHTTAIKERDGGTQPTDTIYNIIPAKKILAHEANIYIEDNFNIGKKFQLNAGLHMSMFNVQHKSYFSLQPRLSARYELTEDVSIKGAYTKMNQYIHLLSSSTISMPTDLWVPVTKDIKPMRAHQYSLGAYYSGLKGWEFSVEGYFKDMRNVLEYKDGTSFLGNSSNWEQKVEMGKGRSFGAEFQIQKTMGRTTGWISYTLAKADRQFSKGGINDGKRFPYKYDRRHTVNLTVNHKFSDKIDVNATWVFATGNTTTLSEEQTALIIPKEAPFNYSIFYQPKPLIYPGDHIGSRNNYRLPSSHRLNVGINFRKKTKRGERIWNVGLYNAYNAMNPNFVYWTTNDNDELVLKKITILPLIPSFTYTYKF